MSKTIGKKKFGSIFCVTYLVAVATIVALTGSGCRTGDRSRGSHRNISRRLPHHNNDLPAYRPAPNQAPSVPTTGMPAEPSTLSSRLRPGMVLNIVVLVAGREMFVESSKRISENGYITLPLLGNMMVQGHSLASLAAALSKSYSDYFVEPQIVVDFAREEMSMDGIYPWGYVTVLGRVRSPGRVAIPATRDLTVSRAIQQAGGLNTSARDTSIRVTRQTALGETETTDVNLRAIGEQGRIGEDIVLQPGDVVFIPELRF